MHDRSWALAPTRGEIGASARWPLEGEKRVRVRLLPGWRAVPWLGAVGLSIASLVGAQGSAYRVRDINTSVITDGSSNPFITVVNGTTVFFTASDASHGAEVWRTDGSGTGTVMLRDFMPGMGRGTAYAFGTLGSQTFIAAGDDCTGVELWVTDGNPSGTSLLAEINTGAGNSYPGAAMEFNGRLYFSAYSDDFGGEIWASDGTPPGTARVTDLNPGPGDSGAVLAARLGGTLLLWGTDGTSGIELWRSDGTTAGTTMVRDINSGPASTIALSEATVAGVYYFSATDGVSGIELWRSDGTTLGTYMVADIAPGPASSLPLWLADINGTLFFSANDGTAGTELWTSDGTAIGTRLVADIAAGPASSSPASLTDLNGICCFVADDGLTGFELWRSDGTLTALVRDFVPGSGTSRPGDLAAIAGRLYLLTSLPEPRAWISDGTGAGTLPFDTIYPVPAGLVPTLPPVDRAGTIFFPADDGLRGDELWMSDGTATGTGLVKNINPPLTSAALGEFTDGGGYLAFAEATTTGGVLWQSAGTDATTTPLLSFQSVPRDLLRFGNSVLFSASSPPTGDELWTTDGTSVGTAPLVDLVPGSQGSMPAALTRVGSAVYFLARDASGRQGLWRTDGSAAATALVDSSAPGPAWAAPASVAAAGSLLFFATSVLPAELWRSDGTAAGTMPLRAFDHDPVTNRSIDRPHAVGSWALFAAQDAATGFELWASDGTTAGTFIVKDIQPGPGSSLVPRGGAALEAVVVGSSRLFFAANDGIRGEELWVSDGSDAGTMLVKDIDVSTVGYDTGPRSLFSAGSYLLFAACDGSSGYELWRSDGTDAGTVMVKDIATGSPGSDPHDFALLPDGRVIFAATDGISGTEPWVTDGSGPGTRLLADVAPGPADSMPTDFHIAGTAVYFMADPTEEGRELWAIVIASGEVPDGTAAGSQPLLVTKASGTGITLAWDGSCAPTDIDHSVHEGVLDGSFSAHGPILCSTAGARSVTITPRAGNAYYLIGALSTSTQGSLGRASDGVERSAGVPPCLPLVAAACPP